MIMYSCSHCDTQHLKWTGRCTECGQWGTISEDGGQTPSLGSKKKSSAKAAPVLALSTAAMTQTKHIPTALPELDRVLGGGLVPGSVTLLAGEPGIGKSTIVAQLADTFSREQAGKIAYYASGEESEAKCVYALSVSALIQSTSLFQTRLMFRRLSQRHTSLTRAS